jgi:hypothetical protein
MSLSAINGNRKASPLTVFIVRGFLLKIGAGRKTEKITTQIQ